MPKNILTKIVSVIIFLLIFIPQTKVLAGNYIWEVSLPGVSLQQLNNLNGFGDLVNIVVRLAYRIAMLFMLYKLIMIGFKYMTNRGNADVTKAVSEGLKNVIFGALILFGSYIILYTINPKLTEFPQKLYCNPAHEVCDEKTNSKSATHVDIACDSYVEDSPAGEEGSENNGATDAKAAYSTSDEGVDQSEIEGFIDDNSDYFVRTWETGYNDWIAAQQDLKSGKTSNSVWEAIQWITDRRKLWYETNCGKLVWGPIYTSHKKPAGATYTSCHDTYEAIDLVVNDNNGKISVYCTSKFLTYLRQSGLMNSIEVMLCDETNFKDVTPHIHIYDTDCSTGCRVN